MPRLPVPGEDENVWGTILNGFLLASHNNDATLKSDAVQQALPTATDGQALVYDSTTQRWQPGTISASGIDDSNLVHKTGTETITGSKNFTGGLTLYGIGVVQTDDVRLEDEREPVDGSVTDIKVSSTANISQSKIAGLTDALDDKISVSEKGAPNGVASLDADGKLPNSQIEPQPAATAETLGTIRLSGDIGGTAQTPLVTKLRGSDVSSATPSDGQALIYSSGTWSAQDIQPAGYVRGDGVAKITVSDTAPTSPSIGDVWIDTAA